MPSSHASTSSTHTISRWTKLECYFFNHGANIAFLTLMIVFNVCMFVWGVWLFIPGIYYTDNEILRKTLPIARGGGRLVTWNAACLLVSGCKYFWTLVRKTPIRLGFPVDDIMPKYHRIFALTVIVSGCIIHTIPQIVNYATQSLVPVNGQDVWGDGISPKQLLYTGSMLVVIFTMFFVTTLEKVRRTSFGFRLFWWCHIIGIVCSGPLLLVHGTCKGKPVTIYFLLLPIALYLVDVIVRRYCLATLQADLVSLETHTDGSDNYVKVTIRQKEFQYAPGMYAELRISEISHHEWHPFTIASAPNSEGTVVFYIQAVGKWTKRLLKLAKQQHASGENGPVLSKIGIRGGFGAPAQNYFSYKHIVVVGSGIGVTPLLSVWKHMVATCRADLDMTRVPRSKSFRVPDSIKYSQILLDGDLNHVDVTEFDRPLISIPIFAAYYSSVLETMTVNICIFVFALTTEMAIFCVWLFGLTMEGAFFQAVASMITLTIFGTKIVASTVAYGKRYLKSFVYLLELGIFVLDAISYGTSVSAIAYDRHKDRIAYFYVSFIVLHSVRIFHFFFSTARPPKLKNSIRNGVNDNTDPEAIKTITGVWVGRTYQGMSFAAADLVDSLQNLTQGFSLQLYASRDKPEDCARNDPFVGLGHRFALKSGRPDWEDIIRRALDAAHLSSDGEGENVGVFFCGSPAIAFILQHTAQEVTAEHQYNNNGSCTCRVRVHKENF
ncbi:hypothetical protein MPSEU_000362300 [Mayamaea pseudoterrestris]|nr:hypothetical protein MPSEU_000362300 [Mayamaea pseudoterrestris]